MTILQVFSNEIWSTLLVALLHSLWQGALIAAVAVIVLGKLAANRVYLRYTLTLIALMGIVIMVPVTWAFLAYEPATTPLPVEGEKIMVAKDSGEATTIPNTSGEKTSTIEPSATAPTATSPWVAWGVIAWLGGVIAMLARTTLLLFGAHRLRRQCSLIDKGFINDTVKDFCHKMKLTRRVLVAAGDHIVSPAVVGIFRVTILLPVSYLSGIESETLRAVVAHELAHIRRYDYLVNLVQMLVEAVFFFNPAVWWVSHRIRIEREACCDADAVALLGEHAGYARALAGAARDAAGASFILQPAQVFGSSKNTHTLLERIKRIVIPGYRPRVRLPWYTLSSLLLAGLLVIAGVWRGTFLTVTFATDILTPQERMQQIAEINSTYGVDSREYTEQDNITISGKVVTEENEPISNYYIYFRSHRQQGNMAGIAYQGNQNTFSRKIYYGEITLLATAPGYAPVYLGPLTAEPGGSIDDLVITMTKGFSGYIIVKDEEGKPLPGVTVQYSYAARGVPSRHLTPTTDSEGKITIEHTSRIPMEVEIKAPGYEKLEETVALTPDSTTAVVSLSPALPARGIVVSETTGEPVSGARLILVREEGPNSCSYQPSDDRTWGITGDDGRFSLDTLRDDTMYTSW